MWIRGQVGGWIDRRMGAKDVWMMGEWMNGQMDRRVGRYLRGWISKETERQTDKWTDGQMGRWMDQWME